MLLFPRSGGKDGGSYEPHRYPPIFVYLQWLFFFNTCMGRIASFPLIHPSMECQLAWSDLWLHAGDTLTIHNRSFCCHSFFFSFLKQLHFLSLLCTQPAFFTFYCQPAAILNVKSALSEFLLPHIFTPLLESATCRVDFPHIENEVAILNIAWLKKESRSHEGRC